MNIELTVQLNATIGKERHLDLNMLHDCLCDDPQLSTIHRDQIGRFILFVYTVSGCDYVSYFKGYGKAAFYKTAFQFSNFIWNGGLVHNQSKVPGTFHHLPESVCSSCSKLESHQLCQVCEESIRESVCVFFRSVGTMYYQNYIWLRIPCLLKCYGQF